MHRSDEAENSDTHRGAKQRKGSLRHRKLDAELDPALEDSFPGSDPVSVVQPSSPCHKRKR